MKRRDFLKVVGATGAGAAAAGCTTGDVDRLIPYVNPAEEIVPGVPTYYATTCRECPAGCGLHVETHEGRATKVEGNPDHPVSRGNTCARGQASVQGLYHPDRYRGPFTLEDGIDVPNQLSWSAIERSVADRIRRANGRVVYLTGHTTGSMGRLVRDFTQAVGGELVTWAPWQDQPRDLDFSGADLLVSFGADFLETWGSPVEYARQFAAMHTYREGRRGRFVWVGPHRPLTGLSADLWIPCRAGTEARIAGALSGGGDLAAVARDCDVAPEKLQRLAAWWSEAGRPMALGPGAAATGTNASRLRSAVASLNGGGASTTTSADMRPIVRLVERMRSGEIEVLLVDAPNPVYGLPGGLGFAGAMERVPVRVSFSTFPDDTSRRATHVLPDHHFLESWGDYEPRPGVASLVQPTMRPVFNTKQTGDVLLSVASLLGVELGSAQGASTFFDYLRTAWAGRAGGAAAWREAVRRGGVFAGGAGSPDGAGDGVPVAAGVTAGAAAAAQADTTTAVDTTSPVSPVAPPAGASRVPETVEYEEADGAEFNLVVYPSYRFFDGRTANRPWLLELPDPVTKVSWDSWVEVHPESAERLGVEQGDVVEVTSPYGAVRTKVYVYPGVRRDTVAIQTGLGHEGFGRFTEGRGVNPNVLLGATLEPATGEAAANGVRVAVRPTGEDLSLNESLFEQGVRIQHDRELAQAVSVAALAGMHGEGHIPGEQDHIEPLKGSGGFAPVPTETDPAAYPGPGTHYGQYVEPDTRWAMAVDLSRCIGCSACVVACYAENNIPVVGPAELRKGRELAWLRIERYFDVARDEEHAYGDQGTDDVRFFPMLCQQCGNAPCEPVCPVYAAYHTPDGLNGQVYNRCVGTRYCANNCPYKVRVFNWFTYDFPEPLNWQLNPDVTVREKGVMEKCTFCVQRIHEAERDANREDRRVRDGEIAPACVQTCPTEVFVFGDISDPNSAVAQAARSNRSYRALEVLNTQPAVVYLAKVTLDEPRRGAHAAPAHGEEPAVQEAH